MSERVVVIGGGLAGLTAALAASAGGWEVTLLETRPRLGGATHSFRRRFEDGELVVDNGQHVFLRCCSAYRGLLRQLGVEAQTYLQPRLDVPVVDPATGRRARLKRDRLPAPAHLARALLRYRVLPFPQRIRAIRGALALRRVDRDAPASDQMTFGAWLRAHGQTDLTIERLFDVFTVATLNARADEASLRLGAMVFQDGLLRRAGACDIGYARVPLGVLHGDAARAALEKAGADVRLQTKARRIERVGDGWRVTADGEVFEADAVVLATPHDVAAELLPADLVGADVAKTPGNLEVSPIVNVHVVYDRVVLREPFVAAVESPAQFVFDRTHAAGLRGGGQYIAVSVSAADAWIDEPVAKLRELFLPELSRILPAAKDAVVRDFFVTRERHATFRPTPGSGRHRLAAATPAPGLVVAGAWTDTGWPATMEGAVRSGLAAVRALRPADEPHDAASPAATSAPASGMVSHGLRLTRHDDGNRTKSGSTNDSTSGMTTRPAIDHERARQGETAEEALA